jgi:hypothetical protein
MPGAADVVTEYKDLLARTETLIREFQLSLSSGAVITTVVDCRHELVEGRSANGSANAPADAFTAHC